MAPAIQVGWHPRKIQEILGYSSIEVTLGTYGHLLDLVLLGLLSLVWPP